MSIEEKKQRYAELCHAMQTGVAFTMEKNPSPTNPKHLRVGVNSAMVDSAALARLLMTKGIITEDEYFDSLIQVMQEEVDRYKSELSTMYGGAAFELG